MSRTVQQRKVSRSYSTHGMTGTPEYLCWVSMKQRTTNANHHAWSHYGGRGIGIDDPRWLRFENFYADMGPRPEGLTLERKNNDLGYSSENCVWATWDVQARNKRNTLRDKTVCGPCVSVRHQALAGRVDILAEAIRDSTT